MMKREHKDTPGRWDTKTKLLHFGMAVFVTIELFSSLFMEESTGPPPLSFEIHEWSGMAALSIVLAHWAWSAFGAKGVGLNHLFPWGTSGRKQILDELRELISLRMPVSGPEGRLSGLVHGLGLLAVTAIAITGAILFFGMPEDGTKLSPFTEGSKELHEFFSIFVWVYWVGHVAMAVTHEIVGRDGTLRDMFKF